MGIRDLYEGLYPCEVPEGAAGHAAPPGDEILNPPGHLVVAVMQQAMVVPED